LKLCIPADEVAVASDRETPRRDFLVGTEQAEILSRALTRAIVVDDVMVIEGLICEQQLLCLSDL